MTRSWEIARRVVRDLIGDDNDASASVIHEALAENRAEALIQWFNQYAEDDKLRDAEIAEAIAKEREWCAHQAEAAFSEWNEMRAQDAGREIADLIRQPPQDRR